jgi:integrase
MPRRAKGPRLWFRAARHDGDGRLTHESAWFILDGTRQRSTGLGPGASAEAKEAALRAYLTEKHTTGVSVGLRDPSQILIDDVLAKYVRDRVSPSGKRKGHSRPHETVTRIRALASYWGGKRLSQVNGDACRDYADRRSSHNAARRELEELRAAINHHRREGLHDRIVSVILPDKPAAREAWLTRDQAANLILSAWRYREQQNHRGTDRRTRRHVARFMLVARYMGSRAAVICGASIEDKRPAGQPWVDLANGVFYGRGTGERETKKRRQRVRVPPPLLAHLRRWRRRGQRFCVEWNGQPVTRVNKAHNAAVAAAGFGPEITPHIWRHTVATWLMQGGADLQEIAEFLAMSVETLVRVYGHHRPDRLPSVFGAMRNRQRIANDKSEQKAISEHDNVAQIAAKSLIA